LPPPGPSPVPAVLRCPTSGEHLLHAPGAPHGRGGGIHAGGGARPPSRTGAPTGVPAIDEVAMAMWLTAHWTMLIPQLRNLISWSYGWMRHVLLSVAFSASGST
jgi:hypothetical protein